MCDKINEDERTQEQTVPIKSMIPESIEQFPNKLSMCYILEQIEKIASQTAYISDAISELRQMNISCAGDIGSASKAEAISEVVKCREATNQQLLRFYEKMYEDIKPKQSLREKALDIANRTLNNPTCGEAEKEQLSDVLDTIRHLNESNGNMTSKLSQITDWVKSLNKDEFDPITWGAITECVKAQLSRNW